MEVRNGLPVRNEMKAGYKKTEVGIIPEEWEVNKLSGFAKILTGSTPPTNDSANYGNKYFFVSPADLGKDKWILNTEKKLSEKGFSISRKFPKNSILFTCIGSTIGKSGIASKEMTSNQQINTVLPNDDYITDYIYYCLSLLALKIKAQASEQAVPIINKSEFGETSIPLPPLPEQKAIAEVLSDTDELIQTLEKQIAKKRMIKQGAMQKLLSPPAQIMNDELSMVNEKEKWEVKKLGEICDVRKGQLITSETKVDGLIPVIAGGKKPAYYHNTANRMGKNITISGSGANAGYVAFHNYPIFASDCSTISESNNYSIEFIYFLLQKMQDKIYKMQTGGAQPHIHPNDINPIEIPFPTLPEQTRIATILSDMDSEIETLEKKLAKYKKIKQGMMQELLTGKSRLIVNDELGIVN